MSSLANIQAALDEAGKVVKRQRTCETKVDACLENLIDLVRRSRCGWRAGGWGDKGHRRIGGWPFGAPTPGAVGLRMAGAALVGVTVGMRIDRASAAALVALSSTCCCPSVLLHRVS